MVPGGTRVHQISYMCTKHDGGFFSDICEAQTCSWKRDVPADESIPTETQRQTATAATANTCLLFKGYWDKIEKTWVFT